MNKARNKIGLCWQDKVLYSVITVIMTLLLIIVLYPLIYVLSSSFSSGSAVSAGRVILWPVQPTLNGYKVVFGYRSVWIGYRNSIIYTLFGTALNIVLTTMVAYPLSVRRFHGRKFVTTLFMIIMFFNGGMIPTYILMSQLHLTNTRWAIILSGGVSVYNMIIMRTFFQNSIPEDLHEAAMLDGVSDIGYLFKIVMPLSKAIYSVITLYYAVAHWNGYFNAMLYLRDPDLLPLQNVLRSILNAARIDVSQITDSDLLEQLIGLSDVMKFSLIVISCVPVLIAYPFVQRFFEKGVMIGSVKG
ncbi:MAG: carbohydrate ABC transporter permease [Lachnospiraceae bacterium]|nr:carbohydrate ABC transporter permease [Lachnospiraceae bacterium]